jgi:hypothetical protein
MEPQEPSDNVYSLFPGIDTAPFGGSAGLSADATGLTDDGWSATPERTIAEATGLRSESLNEHPRSGFRGHRRLGVPSVRWLLVGIGVGAAIAAAAAIVFPAGDHSAHRIEAAVSHHARAVHKPGAKRESHHAHHRARRHHVVARRPKTRRHAVKKRSTVIATSYTPTSATTYNASSENQAPTYTPPPPSDASQGQSGGSAPVRPAASHASHQSAGPTGPGALTGAGSTPSG